jgi:hypothetical protein
MPAVMAELFGRSGAGEYERTGEQSERHADGRLGHGWVSFFLTPSLNLPGSAARLRF